jgi:hypothetical protein
MIAAFGPARTASQSDDLNVLERISHPSWIAFEILEPHQAELHVVRCQRIPARKLHIVTERECILQTVGRNLDIFSEKRNKRGEILGALRDDQGIVGVQVHEGGGELKLASGVECLDVGLVIGHDQGLIPPGCGPGPQRAAGRHAGEGQKHQCDEQPHDDQELSADRMNAPRPTHAHHPFRACVYRAGETLQTRLPAALTRSGLKSGYPLPAPDRILSDAIEWGRLHTAPPGISGREKERDI